MKNTREVIVPEGMEVLYEKYHYCPGIKVGNTLYISGQVGRDENLQIVGGTEAQFVQAFENVKKVLLAAGATFNEVVEMIKTKNSAFLNCLRSPSLPPRLPLVFGSSCR